MTKFTAIFLYTIFGFIVCILLLDAKIQRPDDREAEIRRIAIEVSCRTIVEAKLVRSCTPAEQK
jgi:hypothetical protein